MAKLTRIQAAVLAMSAAGERPRDIASRLGLTPGRTGNVRTRLRRLGYDVGRRGQPPAETWPEEWHGDAT